LLKHVLLLNHGSALLLLLQLLVHHLKAAGR
jgi:hypothetical protein